MFKSSSTSSIKQLLLFGSSGTKSLKNLKTFNGHSCHTVLSQRCKATALSIAETKTDDNNNKTNNYVPTIDQRAKFGHTGRHIQEKISLEVSKQIQSPTKKIEFFFFNFISR